MKKKAIIFDIDNTILYQTNRNPFNWSDLSGDKVIPQMDALIDHILYVGEYSILLVSGRPESTREATQEWLLTNDIPYDKLYLKQGDPMGKSVIHKEATLLEIEKEFEVFMVFEDDNKCAEMYRSHGIFTLMPLNYKVEHLKKPNNPKLF